MTNVRLLTVLASCIAICSCSGTDQESGVVGDWETDPVLGQLGTTINRQTLRDDGTFSASVELPDMNAMALEAGDSPMPAITVEGTYSVEGNRITFVMPDQTTTSTFRFEGETLIMEEEVGTDVFRYHRKARFP